MHTCLRDAHPLWYAWPGSNLGWCCSWPHKLSCCSILDPGFLALFSVYKSCCCSYSTVDYMLSGAKVSGTCLERRTDRPLAHERAGHSSSQLRFIDYWPLYMHHLCYVLRDLLVLQLCLLASCRCSFTLRSSLYFKSRFSNVLILLLFYGLYNNDDE